MYGTEREARMYEQDNIKTGSCQSLKGKIEGTRTQSRQNREVNEWDTENKKQNMEGYMCCRR